MEKVELYKELLSGGYEASVITTYNAYLPFYEDVLLRKLMNSGVKHNSVLMDSKQLAASFSEFPPKFAGVTYSLIPISVPGAFHPKLIMLVGPKKVLIATGSHNLTLSGFGFNREMTGIIKFDPRESDEGKNLARQAWREVQYWVDEFAQGVPEQAKEKIAQFMSFAPWLSDQPSVTGDVRIIGSRPGSISLWEQIGESITGEVERISGISAFFDKKLSFLNKLRAEYHSSVITVGIDPKTVSINAAQRESTGARFVNTSTMGSEEGEGRGYLHAKSLLISQRDGEQVLAVGSANLSANAWLAENSGSNVEVMLILAGKEAAKQAKKIGMDTVDGLPELAEDDWAETRFDLEGTEMGAAENPRIGLCIKEGSDLLIPKEILKEFSEPMFIGVGLDGHAVCTTTSIDDKEDHLRAQYKEGELESAITLNIEVNSKVVAKAIIHNPAALDRMTSSKRQAQLRSALESLESGSPNVQLLVSCIDKIVFSDSSDKELRRAISGKKPSDDLEQDTPETLQIDVDEIRKRKGKKRQKYEGDFAYLIDTLVYHLRIGLDRDLDILDEKGRSEEEIVGADDDENEQEKAIIRQDVLKICHSKIRTLTNRLKRHLALYKSERRDLELIVARCLAVLAVIRELRKCDSKCAWVGRGNTTVPESRRLELLDSIVFSLMEGNGSLMDMSNMSNDLRESEDFSRLKGLLLWLAWDCGLVFDLREPFLEPPESRHERLQRNAIILSLSQLCLRDQLALEEATSSIGSLSAAQDEWLRTVKQLHEHMLDVQSGKTEIVPAQSADQNSLILLNTKVEWSLRVANSLDAVNAHLINLDKDKPVRQFLSKKLSAVSYPAQLGRK